MKKIVSCLLVCVLLLAALSLPAAAEEPAPVTAGEPVRAGTVDELLAAIAPDTTILLEPGDYCLQDASGYGVNCSEYWYWADCYDGYELVISGADGLTIRASEGTRLLTAPRYANVLLFRDCGNITLSGLTLGHAPEGGACCGSVVSLESCSGITLEDCVLFGCGVTALNCFDCNTVQVLNSTLTDCSYSGAEFYRCRDVLFNGCTFSDNGGEDEYTGAVLYLDSTRYVTVMNSTFTGNKVGYMLQTNASSGIELLGCKCEETELKAGFFYLEAADVTVTNCAFTGLNEGNAFAAAYNPGRTVDRSGNELSLGALLVMKQILAEEPPVRAEEPAPAPAVGGTEQHCYEVGTADELLAAIGSHRVICLTADIDLSTATGIGTGWTESWRWSQVDDGAELIIHDVKGMTLIAKQPGLRIITSPRHANVLSFYGCRNITLGGLTVGHTEIPNYECSGAVLFFSGCTGIEIDDCALFGCGTLGVSASGCRELEIEDTEIYDCTIGAMELYSVGEVEIEHCNIHDCNEPALYFDTDCWAIQIDEKEFSSGFYYANGDSAAY